MESALIIPLAIGVLGLVGTYITGRLSLRAGIRIAQQQARTAERGQDKVEDVEIGKILLSRVEQCEKANQDMRKELDGLYAANHEKDRVITELRIEVAKQRAEINECNEDRERLNRRLSLVIRWLVDHGIDLPPIIGKWGDLHDPDTVPPLLPG